MRDTKIGVFTGRIEGLFELFVVVDDTGVPRLCSWRELGAQPWNSGIVNQDEEFEQPFDVPGEYTYFCIPPEAAGMIGYLTVEA